MIPPPHPGYIDLSKRRVSPEDIEKCEEKFAKARAVSLCFYDSQKFHLAKKELSH